jgi:hypothetical protein
MDDAYNPSLQSLVYYDILTDLYCLNPVVY